MTVTWKPKHLSDCDDTHSGIPDDSYPDPSFGLASGIGQDGSMTRSSPPRFCVWCGSKVPKRATRDLCPGHRQVADALDEQIRLQAGLDDDPPPTPSVPVYREPDA